MATIYSLESNGIVWYVGSTNDHKRRLREHRNLCSHVSRSIPREYDWHLVILETCAETDRFVRERHWYEEKKPFLNLKHPGRSPEETQKEYLATHRTRATQVRTAWAKRNPEKVKDAQARYRAKKNAADFRPGSLE